jgi:murein L,D-transpeptidase YcbB/YkuD
MLRLPHLAFLIVAFLLLIAPPSWAQGAGAAPTLRTLLEGEGSLTLEGRDLDRSVLAPIYAAYGYESLWVSSPKREAALQAALAGAEAHGLDAAPFRVAAGRAEKRDLLLTDAFLRYAQALARGRVSAAETESDWGYAVPAFDGPATLAQALSGEVGEVLAGLAPSDPGYRRLQQALTRYRAITVAGGWRHLPEGPALRPGDEGSTIALLRRRLAAEGYLAAAGADAAFDDALADAVRRFQAQHGIAIDGTVGPATFRALNISAAARIEQIADNLERWRELPRGWPMTRIEVNVPAASLTFIDHGEASLVMRAIIGAEDHPTPALRARVNAVLFNPAWTVPASIVTNEILPRLKRDPRYLERNHYAYLGRPRASALQQRPGPNNALGRVKFEMPNLYDVYLHDTPSHPPFGQPIRALSHGCVRLEDPRRLAAYLLADQPGWDAADIDRVIDRGATERVALTHSMPVYLLYWTAFSDTEGNAEFRDDLYGRDRRLAAAMAERDNRERPAHNATATAAN